MYHARLIYAQCTERVAGAGSGTGSLEQQFAQIPEPPPGFGHSVFPRVGAGPVFWCDNALSQGRGTVCYHPTEKDFLAEHRSAGLSLRKAQYLFQPLPVFSLKFNNEII